MMVGKAENRSASYIDPAANAMRVSAERVAQAKQDVQKNAAEGLLETNVVYTLDISDEGWTRMEAEKKQRTDEKGHPITDGKLEKVICFDKWIPPDPNQEGIRFNPNTDAQEIAPLSENMFSIETSIAGALKSINRADGLGDFAESMRNLGMALNAYLHKQWNAVTTGRDTYLKGLDDRLDQLDNTNPVVWQIRNMLSETMNGREIGVQDDKFLDTVRKIWDEYQAFYVPSEEDASKEEDLFNEKTAMYCYMQKLARWQAERDGDLVEEMTGEGSGEKEIHIAGEVLRNTSLEDGVKAIQDNRYVWRKFQHEDKTPLTEKEWDEENEKELFYAAGYDWNLICQQYLKENPDMAAIFEKSPPFL